MNLLTVAKRYLAAGFSVIPIRGDGSKAPDSKSLPPDADGRPTWKPFQERHPSLEELHVFFGEGGAQGIAILTGAISANLEVIDFDAEGFFERWRSTVDRVAPGLVDTLPCVLTAGGGRHIYIRSTCLVSGNMKLAWHLQDGKRKVAIETRGEGGYVLAPGCSASCHPSGKLYEHDRSSPGADSGFVLSPEERAILLNAAKSLSEVEERPRLCPPPREEPHGSNGERRPGDDFNARGSWMEILVGWTRCYEHGGLGYWRRPGKSDGTSATTGPRSNCGGADLLHNFSSNVPQLEADKSYTKFTTHILLKHGGDAKAAARELSQRGYGEPRALARRDQNSAALVGVRQEKDEEGEDEEELEDEDSTPLILYVSPPLDVLSGTERSYAEAVAKSTGADVAIPMHSIISTTSAAIGLSRRIRLKRGWVEPGGLSSVVVSPSGALKTTPLRAPIEPFFEIENDDHARFAVELEEHEKRLLEYEKALGKWKKGGVGPPPMKPQAAPEPRRWTSDVTVEGLGLILESNPRGVLVYRDEFSTFFQALNAYRSGRGGDAGKIMELLDAGPLVVDRAGVDPLTRRRKSIRLHRAMIVLNGTIQPEILKSCATPEVLQAGLLARIRIYAPPPADGHWRDAEVPAWIEERYMKALRRLGQLEMRRTAAGRFEPLDLDLTSEAKRVFIENLNLFVEQTEGFDGALGAVAAKLRGFAARYALRKHCATWAEGVDPEPGPVSTEAVKAAWDFVRWQWREERRVYRYVLGAGKALPLRLLKLVRYLERRREPVRAHEVASGPRQYRGRAEQAELDLEELARRKLAHRIEPPPPGENGGHPGTPFYELVTSRRHDNLAGRQNPEVVMPHAMEHEPKVGPAPAAQELHDGGFDCDQEDGAREVLEL